MWQAEQGGHEYGCCGNQSVFQPRLPYDYSSSPYEADDMVVRRVLTVYPVPVQELLFAEPLPSDAGGRWKWRKNARIKVCSWMIGRGFLGAACDDNLYGKLANDDRDDDDKGPAHSL